MKKKKEVTSADVNMHVVSSGLGQRPTVILQVRTVSDGEKPDYIVPAIIAVALDWTRHAGLLCCAGYFTTQL